MLAESKLLWHSASPVLEKTEQHSAGESIDDLQQTVDVLSNEVRVLRDVLDEIREDFHWALRNGHTDSVKQALAIDDVSTESDEQSIEHNELKDDDAMQEEPLEVEAIAISVEFVEDSESDEEELDEHEQWVKMVRDPAYEKSEGLRKLQVLNGKATAEYEVAPLPGDCWALTFSLSYWCGNCEGFSTPWSEYESREACVEQFEHRAINFFGKLIDNGGNEVQKVARIEMLANFEGGLFGFVEPDVVEQKDDVGDFSTTESSNEDTENLQPLKHQILEYLASRVGAIVLNEIQSDMGYSGSNPADPLENPVNRALVDLQSDGNVSVIETDFGEPSFLFLKPLYHRPDRQENFDGIPSYDWPDAEEDRDTLTVDRVGDNGDGGEHRFTVKRGDTVEAFFARDKQKVGKVVGISHANREVRVAFSKESEGTWFAIGSIYPALEPASDDDEELSTVPLSDVIETANSQNTPQEKEWSEADRVPSSTQDSQSQDSQNQNIVDALSNDSAVHTPNESKLPEQQQQPKSYTLDDFESFLQRVNTGDLSALELRADFARLYSSRKSV